jgi:hypothetical protein
MSEVSIDRERLIASHQTASDSFDRALMTLAGGSLGLSIAFVKDIAPHPVAVWAIQTSWVCMGVALALILLSFAASAEVHRRVIAGLEARRPYEQEPRWVRWGVTWLNVVAAASFVAGAAFLIYFASVNV